MSVYTKIGDEGKTTFFGCGLVAKNDPRIEAFGALDELNSVIGITLCFIEDQKLRKNLEKVQNDLFQLGADVAGSEMGRDRFPRIRKEHVKELESHIDIIHSKLGNPKSFILPNGTVASSFLHLCRAITRRAERTLVSLKSSVPHLNSDILIYINRLSDLMFCLARESNKELSVQEQQPIYKYFKKKDND